MLLQIHLDSGILQALTAIIAVYIVVVTGLTAWYIQELLKLKANFDRLDQSLRGTEDVYDEGFLGRSYSDMRVMHKRLDTLELKIDDLAIHQKDSSSVGTQALIDAIQILGDEQKSQREDIEAILKRLED